VPRLLALVVMATCGTRTVGGPPPAEPVAPVAAPSSTDPDPVPVPVPVPAPAPVPDADALAGGDLVAPAAPASQRETDLATALQDPVQRASRRARFAHAVEQISRQLGNPISGERALADMPCGGWSGPACSNLTLGLEVAKLAAPLAARLYDDRAGAVAAVLVEAISIHSVWHDAFGYVQTTLGRGPGYTYAGCLLSRCNPADYTCGQLDGVLYQAARLVGLIDGPECGPGCTLAP
jgi:hypothetical protein